MAKVSKIIDPDLCNEEMRMKFPECTRVEVRLNNGTVLDGTCLSAQGMPSRPLTDDDLAKKFRACASFADLETPDIDEAIAALMNSGQNSGLNSELRPGSKSRGHETRALLEKLWSGN
jgi:2-methylcitrate dehydratase PrpD